MSGPPVDQAEGPAPAVAGFEDLAQEAQLLSGGPAPGAAAGPSPAEQMADTAGELLQALQMARMLVAPMFRWMPDFHQVWADSTLQGISQAGAAVMQRHGWTLGEFWDKWGPYVALGMSTAPPCFVTYQAIQSESTRRKAEAARPTPTPSPAPAPTTTPAPAANGSHQQAAN